MRLSQIIFETASFLFIDFFILVAESRYGEIFSSYHGKLLLAPGLMPREASAKSVLGIANAVLKLAYRRLEAHTAFKIDVANVHVALSLFVAVKLNVGG